MNIATPVALALGLVAAGTADARAEGLLLIESHRGAREASTAALIQTLRAELDPPPLTPATVFRRAEQRLSKPSPSLSPAALQKTLNLVEKGFRSYQRGRFSLARRALQRAAQDLKAHPATLAHEPSARRAYGRALIYLGVTLKHLGHEEHARATMAEYIRSFPKARLSRTEHGEQPRALHRRVRVDLNRRRGRLLIDCDDPDVSVFINGRRLGRGSREVSNLVAGVYEVYVEKSERAGRVHSVSVRRGQAAVLTIVWPIDRALRTRPGWIGFEFENATRRRQLEPRLAATVAEQIGAEALILVGAYRLRDRPHLVGTRLSIDTGRPLVRGALPISATGPSSAQLSSLAKLLGSAPGPNERGEIVFLEDPPPPALAEPPAERAAELLESPSRPVPSIATTTADPGSSAWKWTLVGGGLAVAGAGAVLLALHDPGVDCFEVTNQPGDMGFTCVEGQPMLLENPRDTLIPGIALAAGGGLAAVIGGVLLLPVWGSTSQEGPEPTHMGWVPMQGGGLFVAKGRF